MNLRHGEVWLVDMGMAAKTRPRLGVVTEADLKAVKAVLVRACAL